MQALFLLLPAMAPADGSGGGSAGTLIFIGLFFVIIYFFMIRPQQKKASQQKNFLSEIKKGDRVVTSGGIHGRVVKVDDGTVLLEIDSNTKIRIEKSMVSMDFTKTTTQAQGGDS